MEFALDLKSAGLPVIFQRSVMSPNPLPPVLKSLPPLLLSSTSHGWAVCTVTMVLSFHPSSNWP